MICNFCTNWYLVKLALEIIYATVLVLFMTASSMFGTISYILNIRKGIYNLVGRVQNRDIVAIYRAQNIYVSTIYQTIKEREEGIYSASIFSHVRVQRLLETIKDKVVDLQ